MPADESYRFTDAAELSVVNIRARACSARAQATWAQVVITFASVALFVALFVGAITRDPASLLGARLSLIALAVASWAFIGSIRSHLDAGV